MTGNDLGVKSYVSCHFTLTDLPAVTPHCPSHLEVTVCPFVCFCDSFLCHYNNGGNFLYTVGWVTDRFIYLSIYLYIFLFISFYYS